jgi:hypothetical protein
MSRWHIATRHHSQFVDRCTRRDRWPTWDALNKPFSGRLIHHGEFANLHFEVAFSPGAMISGSNREDCSSQSRLQHALHLQSMASDPVPTSSCRFASTARCGDAMGQYGLLKNSLVTLPAFGRARRLAGSKLACVPLLDLEHHHQSHPSNSSPPFELPVRVARPGSRVGSIIPVTLSATSL